MRLGSRLSQAGVWALMALAAFAPIAGIGAPSQEEADRACAEAEKAYTEARDLIRRGEKEVWPKEGYMDCVKAMRRIVEQWPNTEVAEEAQEDIAGLMWGRLDDASTSVREYQRLLELFPLSAYAEDALEDIHWLCQTCLGDPKKARPILSKYLRSLQTLLKKASDPEKQAAALYLSGLTEYYLGKRNAVNRLLTLKQRYPETEWAKRAERYLVFREIDFAARLRTIEDTEYRSNAQDLASGMTVRKKLSRRVQVNVEAWNPALIDYTLTMSAKLAAEEASPHVKITKMPGDNEHRTATWRYPKDMPDRIRDFSFSTNYDLSSVETDKCPNITITRRSEDLGKGRRRITLFVKVPERVYVDVGTDEAGRILGNTVSPKPDSGFAEGGLAFWGGYGRDTSKGKGLDCSQGGTFSFEILLPKDIDTFYPSVEVGTWDASGNAKVETRYRGLDATFGDMGVTFTAARNCKVEMRDCNVRRWFTLETILTRKTAR